MWIFSFWKQNFRAERKLGWWYVYRLMKRESGYCMLHVTCMLVNIQMTETTCNLHSNIQSWIYVLIFGDECKISGYFYRVRTRSATSHTETEFIPQNETVFQRYGDEQCLILTNFVQTERGEDDYVNREHPLCVFWENKNFDHNIIVLQRIRRHETFRAKRAKSCSAIV